MSQARAAIGKSRLLEFFQRYGWMLLFCIMCFTVYSQAMHKKSGVCSDLREKILELESLKASMEMEREDLALQIHSQSDSDWIEMILKKRLGVVPEGQMKVYFKKEE